MKKAKQLELPIAYPDSGRWFVPVRQHKIDERTYALRMGKPVQLGTPFLSMYYYADVAEFLDKTRQDPNFWTEARKDAYLNGDSPEDSSVIL